MIEELKGYKIEGKFFAERKQAEAYQDYLQDRKIMVIRSGPDLTEGRHSFCRQEIFIITRNFEKELKPGQNTDTLVKLVEIAKGKRGPKWQGVMGTIQFMPTFTVIIKNYEDINSFTADYVKCIVHENPIVLNEIPYNQSEAIAYVEELLQLPPIK